MKAAGKNFKTVGQAGEPDSLTDFKAALFPNPAALTAFVGNQTRTFAAPTIAIRILIRTIFSPTRTIGGWTGIISDAADTIGNVTGTIISLTGVIFAKPAPLSINRHYFHLTPHSKPPTP